MYAALEHENGMGRVLHVNVHGTDRSVKVEGICGAAAPRRKSCTRLNGADVRVIKLSCRFN